MQEKDFNLLETVEAGKYTVIVEITPFDAFVADLGDVNDRVNVTLLLCVTHDYKYFLMMRLTDLAGIEFDKPILVGLNAFSDPFRIWRVMNLLKVMPIISSKYLVMAYQAARRGIKVTDIEDFLTLVPREVFVESMIVMYPIELVTSVMDCLRADAFPEKDFDLITREVELDMLIWFDLFAEKGILRPETAAEIVKAQERVLALYEDLIDKLPDRIWCLLERDQLPTAILTIHERSERSLILNLGLAMAVVLTINFGETALNREQAVFTVADMLAHLFKSVNAVATHWSDPMLIRRDLFTALIELANEPIRRQLIYGDYEVQR